MISSKGKSNQNREFNWIWNGALSYGYKPVLTVTDLSGNPSFYMNLIIGLAIKYFGRDAIEELFALWEDKKNYEKFAKDKEVEEINYLCNNSDIISLRRHGRVKFVDTKRRTKQDNYVVEGYFYK